MSILKFGTNLEGDAVDFTKYVCTSLLLQNAVRITKTIQQMWTYFASNFLGLIWRGARWILQNACAEVCYYKTQSASQKPSALAPAYCQRQETVCLAKWLQNSFYSCLMASDDVWIFVSCECRPIQHATKTRDQHPWPMLQTRRKCSYKMWSNYKMPPSCSRAIGILPYIWSLQNAQPTLWNFHFRLSKLWFTTKCWGPGIWFTTKP